MYGWVCETKGRWVGSSRGGVNGQFLRCSVAVWPRNEGELGAGEDCGGLVGARATNVEFWRRTHGEENPVIRRVAGVHHQRERHVGSLECIVLPPSFRFFDPVPLN